MSEEDFGHPQDQTRMCPTCRMPISILATRCRHCGETVGRPRKAEEKFTVQDLGGEATSEYTVSGDLMDAMESFRMELSSEDSAKVHQDKSNRWFSRESKGQSGDRKSQYSDIELPSGNLDDLANADISYATPPPRPSTNTTRTQRKDHTKLYIAVGVVVAVVIVFVFFGSSIKEMVSPPPEVRVEYDNRALNMIEAGRPTIEALEEARNALNHSISDANKAIAAQVREKFIAEISAILNARKYEKAPLEEALRQTTRAADIDPDDSLQGLLDQVNKDLNYHRFLLMNIDTENGTATFELNNPMAGEKQQTVAEGDMLQGRFKVDRITSELVRLTDQEIDVPGGKRRLVSRMFKGVTAG